MRVGSEHRSTRTLHSLESLPRYPPFLLTHVDHSHRDACEPALPCAGGKNGAEMGRLVNEGTEEQRLFTLSLTADPQRVHAHVAEPMVNAVRDPGVRLRGGKRRSGGCSARHQPRSNGSSHSRSPLRLNEYAPALLGP